MTREEIDYASRFDKFLSEDRYEEAYGLFRAHPDLIADLERYTVVAAISGFVNTGMEDEARGLIYALQSRSGDEELKDIVEFQQELLDSRESKRKLK